MGAPGIAPSEEPSTPPAARVRWLRRASRKVRVVAAVAAAGVIAAIVFAVIPSSPQSNPPPKPAYTSLPAPCGTISLDALARYLPRATGTPVSGAAAALPATIKTGLCKWSSSAGGENRTLWLYLSVFGAPSAIYDAQQSYDATLSNLDCHCKGVTVSTRRVTGLGDQATAILATAGLDAGISIGTGAGLLVRSSNSEILLSYGAMAAVTPQPPDAAELTWLISLAHGVLADLARPSAVAAAPVVPEPHYTGSRDPCRLISATTLARYAPGAAVNPDVASGNSPKPLGLSSCSWDSSNVFISLQLTVYPNALSAGEGFSNDAQAFSRSAASTKVTGATKLEDPGEEAVAIFQTSSSLGRGVQMLVWSGNIELDYLFSVTGAPAPTSTTLLAAGIAMARDGLAALASPSASSYPRGPVYASPSNACTLVKAATLARYAPGATNDTSLIPSGPVGEQSSNCSWEASNGILNLLVTTYANADGALGGYEIGLQVARVNPDGSTFDGTQPVHGLGDRATAVFVTSLGYPEVDLYVTSGNVEIEMSFAQAPSRAGEFAADIALVRDVLSDLRRT